MCLVPHIGIGTLALEVAGSCEPCPASVLHTAHGLICGRFSPHSTRLATSRSDSYWAGIPMEAAHLSWSSALAEISLGFRLLQNLTVRPTPRTDRK